MTEKEKLLGDISREMIYKAQNTPEYLEMFSSQIPKNFGSTDFLILQFASQLRESAQIRRNDAEYVKMQSTFNDEAFNYISGKYPELIFSISQRFKGALSEVYKRCERIFDEGRSPEIRDLIASKIILLENESQETLSYEYKIAYDLMQHFSVLNSASNFPLFVNLAIPDRQVTKSDFCPEEHPNILLPADNIIIPGLSLLGKDYIYHPKKFGYQAFHCSYELIQKENPKTKIIIELQITTIAQANYEPANHDKYKKKRNEKWNQVFTFEPEKVHINGYYPKYDYDDSGLTKPLHVITKPKTF